MLQTMSGRIQVFAIAGSVLFLVFIIELIRKRKIKEEYGLLWIVVGVIFIVVAVWNRALEVISWLLGIFYAPAAFLLILVVAVFLILIQYSVVISSLNEKNKTLAQELGILKLQLKELADRLSGKDDKEG